MSGVMSGQAVAPAQTQQSHCREPQLLCISPPYHPRQAHLLPWAGVVSHLYKVASALQIFPSMFQLGVRTKGKGKGYLPRLPSRQEHLPPGLPPTSHGAELSQEALLSGQGAERMHSFNISVCKQERGNRYWTGNEQDLLNFPELK